MKYYGKTSLSSYLRISLDMLLFLGTVIFLFILGRTIITEDFSSISLKTIVTCSLFIIGSVSLLVVLYNLRRIIDSLVKVTPFVIENVYSLRNIANSCFIIAICYLLNFFINNQYKDFGFIVIDAYGIHTDIEFLIFFFAGCFILILSKVFKQAVEVKEENDFTI